MRKPKEGSSEYKQMEFNLSGTVTETEGSAPEEGLDRYVQMILNLPDPATEPQSPPQQGTAAQESVPASSPQENPAPAPIAKPAKTTETRSGCSCNCSGCANGTWHCYGPRCHVKAPKPRYRSSR